MDTCNALTLAVSAKRSRDSSAARAVATVTVRRRRDGDWPTLNAIVSMSVRPLSDGATEIGVLSFITTGWRVRAVGQRFRTFSPSITSMAMAPSIGALSRLRRGILATSTRGWCGKGSPMATALCAGIVRLGLICTGAFVRAGDEAEIGFWPVGQDTLVLGKEQ